MFKNRVRLPFYLKAPQFPIEANRFRLANGDTKTLAVTIRKVYNLQSDYMSDDQHQKLVIALNHDEVNIEGEKYFGGASLDSDYEITRPDFLDYPLGQVLTKVQVTPFDVTNTNCQTCEQASQLSLEQDLISETIEEGGQGVADTFDNDTICCYPPVAEITWFDTNYLSSATIISGTGVATLTAKNPVATVGIIKLATYRVTCPDGSYDEADIFGSISGSITCEQPSTFAAVDLSGWPSDVTVTWTNPVIPPANGYEWILYEMQTPGTPVASGTVMSNSITFQAPAPGTDYGLYIRSFCSAGVYSPYSEFLFLTPADSGNDCGNFDIFCDDGTPIDSIYHFSYMDCNGNIQNGAITNLQNIERCLLMDIYNNPVYFASIDNVITYNYIGIC